MTLCDHVINRLCDLMGNTPAIKPTTLSSLVAMFLQKLRHNVFICHVITWSRDQSVKWLNAWWSFTINLHIVKCGSHRPHGSGDILFFISHVTSCSHVIIGWSLPSVLTIRLVKVEMIYFNTYDYFNTKCDNSISQAFSTYFVLQSATK